jgi:hypothetical protein
MIRIVSRPVSCLASCVVALAALVATPGTAAASFVQYSSRATFDSLGSFIPVDWGVFGPAGTVISTPAFQTVGGLSIGVASSQGVLARADEGTDFSGDFAVGDHLLTDAGSESDSTIVSFGTPVRGFGTQIDPHDITGPFSGVVDVFSSTDTLLFAADYSGVKTSAEDNSAPFVGVVSSVPDISFVVFLINQPNPALPPQSGAVGINRLDVLTAVPEPASLALLLTGLVAVCAVRRRV